MANCNKDYFGGISPWLEDELRFNFKHFAHQKVMKKRPATTSHI